jgi:hypothetical protein
MTSFNHSKWTLADGSKKAKGHAESLTVGQGAASIGL